MSYSSIDYLQYSCDPDTIARATLFEPHAGRFYNEVAIGHYGEKIYRGNPNSEKWLVIASGKVCADIQSDMTHKHIAETILSNGCSTTRIDIQTTISSSNRYFATVSDVLNACRNGRYETTLPDASPKFIGRLEDVNYKSDGIETMYLGDMKKRGKRGIFRAYDKGLESGMQSDFLTRFECEFRKESAHAQVKRIASGWHLTEVIDNRVHFDTTWWFAAMDNETSDGEEIRRGIAQKNIDDEKMERAKYWEWAKMIARNIGKKMAHEDTEVMIKLYNEIRNEIENGYNQEARNLTEVFKNV